MYLYNFNIWNEYESKIICVCNVQRQNNDIIHNEYCTFTFMYIRKKALKRKFSFCTFLLYHITTFKMFLYSSTL